MQPEQTPRRGGPVRVLQLGSPAGMFGAERWIMALAKHLPSDRIETIVGVIQDEPSGREPPLCEHARSLGFRTLTLRAPGRISQAAVGGLRGAIADMRLDVVHTHFYKPTIVSAFAVRGTECKLLATPHGWNTDAGLKLQAYEWLERLAFARAVAVAPLSAELLRGLRRLPWLNDKLTLIPNGVDLSEVRDSHQIAPEVKASGERGDFVIGYVGQLIARKRVDTLIDAFSRLSGRRSSLFLVGDGDQRNALTEQAVKLGVIDRVHFAGFRDDRLDFLRGFDVLVLPSSLEGIPRCLMEAMAARVPIIGSRIPGITDLIIEGQTGLMFETGSPAGLHECLERLASDSALRQSLADQGYQRVTDSFSAEAMGRQYVALYERLVERGQ